MPSFSFNGVTVTMFSPAESNGLDVSLSFMALFVTLAFPPDTFSASSNAF